MRVANFTNHDDTSIHATTILIRTYISGRDWKIYAHILLKLKRLLPVSQRMCISIHHCPPMYPPMCPTRFLFRDAAAQIFVGPARGDTAALLVPSWSDRQLSLTATNKLLWCKVFNRRKICNLLGDMQSEKKQTTVVPVIFSAPGSTWLVILLPIPSSHSGQAT